jgi:acetyl esterase/lipase
MKLALDRRKLLLGGAAAAVVSTPPAQPVVTIEPSGNTVDVWPSGPPGAENVKVREEIFERLPGGPLRDRYVQHVTQPKLTLFAPKTTWNGVTLLIVPGGGYVRVVLDKEGFEAAEWFTERGFAAAVLRYRLPADGWASGPDAPVHDAMRALRVLRHRNLPTGSQARRIGVIGFSAGGHLTARLITEANLSYPRQDAADEVSARPDFAVLMYPVIDMAGPAAHTGSVNQLRAAGVQTADLDRYAPNLNVTSRTPRTMLIHTADDGPVPVANSLMMYRALLAARVPVQLHVFDAGGHGFGMRGTEGKNVSVWPTLVQGWALANDAH